MTRSVSVRIGFAEKSHDLLAAERSWLVNYELLASMMIPLPAARDLA